MINSASFVKSAASADDFLRTGLPEVAMVGRSNVGKSSLINALTGRKIARTSAAPGKTRLVNYYLIESRLYLVDLPGYGYARGGAESAEAFEALTQQYFDVSEQSRRVAGVFHLIDARHPDLPQDATAFEWLLRTGLPMAVVATKIDKLNGSQKTQVVKGLRHRYGALVLPSSAAVGTGLAEIWKTVEEWVELR